MARGRKPTIDVARAAAIYAETQSVYAVAAAIGASGNGVYLALKRAGVAVRTRGEALKALHADPEFKARHAAVLSERMKALHADPEFKAAHAARMMALYADPEFRAQKIAAIERRCFGFAVPSWVPADLRDTYIAIGRAVGEKAAASHVRRLKREAAL